MTRIDHPEFARMTDRLGWIVLATVDALDARGLNRRADRAQATALTLLEASKGDRSATEWVVQMCELPAPATVLRMAV
jgi:hypothetical protein